MSTKIERERDGAIKFGEKAVDQAMHYAFKVRDLRRAIQRARHLLKVGKPAEADKTLAMALIYDDHVSGDNGAA
jgi:hypothetical protein